ncbi:LysE family transporter [Amycolatopsis sp. FDAARGOS 1241]|uniref:LysE family transporter n=1 Tax=Amycolatopsis sp. FDAARGOS 1241 TaxID=2778070 RepID=UPI0019522840|nr:LysE family transporter [Amycolatopsis sp. FDAARGOS 1241]QRP44887.1 LysE family transporter [Amycolatopsis sp. FDAARGOS 1241]
MTAPLVAGALAGYGIAVPVGAVGAVLVGLAARTSLRVAAAAALGVATADGVYAVAAVAGGAALTPVVAPVLVPLRWASVVVLTALAAYTAATAIRRYRAGDRAHTPAPAPVGAARAYVSFLGLTVLNPATVLYFAALVVGGTAAGSGAVFALAAFAASASWQLLLAAGGLLLGRVLDGRRGRLGTALVSSAVTIGLAARLLFPG